MFSMYRRLIIFPLLFFSASFVPCGNSVLSEHCMSVSVYLSVADSYPRVHCVILLFLCVVRFWNVFFFCRIWNITKLTNFFRQVNVFFFVIFIAFHVSYKNNKWNIKFEPYCTNRKEKEMRTKLYHWCHLGLALNFVFSLLSSAQNWGKL